jgi:ribonuclease HII
MQPSSQYEKILWQDGYCYVAGVDEVGRGCLAGPVVAGAVILPPQTDFDNIDDSKKLSKKTREQWVKKIQQKAKSIGIGFCVSEEIDKLNILKASLEAMRRAILNLRVCPDYVLIDGLYKIELPLRQRCLPHGDSQSVSIAAASIIAKVYRDQIMATYHDLFPQYNLRKNKGYPTAEHKKAIKKYGLCYLHRRRFSYD